jgi:hypothetical protein
MLHLAKVRCIYSREAVNCVFSLNDVVWVLCDEAVLEMIWQGGNYRDFFVSCLMQKLLGRTKLQTHLFGSLSSSCLVFFIHDLHLF